MAFELADEIIVRVIQAAEAVGLAGVQTILALVMAFELAEDMRVGGIQAADALRISLGGAHAEAMDARRTSLGGARGASGGRRRATSCSLCGIVIRARVGEQFRPEPACPHCPMLLHEAALKWRREIFNRVRQVMLLHLQLMQHRRY